MFEILKEITMGSNDIKFEFYKNPFIPPLGLTIFLPEIKNVIFNNPATIVQWSDGTKTVVKCQKGDTYSKETGLAMAILKKVYGNRGRYNDIISKWVKE